MGPGCDVCCTAFWNNHRSNDDPEKEADLKSRINHIILILPQYSSIDDSFEAKMAQTEKLVLEPQP
jgi:hypothetical protein